MRWGLVQGEEEGLGFIGEMEERGEASINGGRREETRNGKEAGTPLVTYASGWLAARAAVDGGGGGRGLSEAVD